MSGCGFPSVSCFACRIAEREADAISQTQQLISLPDERGAGRRVDIALDTNKYPVKLTGAFQGEMNAVWLGKIRENIKARVKSTYGVDVSIEQLVLPDKQDCVKTNMEFRDDWRTGMTTFKALVLLDFSEPVVIDAKMLNVLFEDFPRGSSGWECQVPETCPNLLRLQWVKEIHEASKGFDDTAKCPVM
ncbi:hypothetical protein BJX99DRAFT_253973 [Aspergillus californicus]